MVEKSLVVADIAFGYITPPPLHWRGLLFLSLRIIVICFSVKGKVIAKVYLKTPLSLNIEFGQL